MIFSLLLPQSRIILIMQKRLATMLYGLLVIAGGLSSCSSLSEVSAKTNQSASPNNVSPLTLSQNSPAASDIVALEQSVHQQVNQYRKSKNLPPLTLNSTIIQQARNHSQAMANGTVPFSHDGFESRVKEIGKTISYRSAAENVAYNQGYTNPDKQAVEGWIKSAGHQRNMVGNFDLTGIGVSKNAKGEYYFTQIFIKRR